MFLPTFSISHNQSGFSLVEVLITAAIISIVTGLVVVRYGAFNSSVLLKNQAYELALDLREAQVFAVSVRGEAGSFREEYGITFTNNSGQYQLFRDLNDDGQYETGEELGPPYTLDSRFLISDVLVDGGTQAEASVVFKRPDFDAVIKPAGTNPSASEINIIIQSQMGNNETRTVTVTKVGQIVVQ